MSSAKVISIACLASNRVIGVNGGLPWHLKNDFLHFKRETLGFPIIMGRLTWDSLSGKALPKRLNIVITKQKDLVLPEGVLVYDSVKKAVDQHIDQHEKIFIIGGAQIYQQAIDQNLCDELCLTEIHHDFYGDILFPLFNKQDWQETERRPGEDEEFPHAFDYVTYKNLRK